MSLKPEKSFFDPTIENLVTEFEAKLLELVDPLLLRYPTALRESALYSLKGGGKRIRPRIVFGVGLGLGTPKEILFSLAAAVETIHTYTLIHDDLPAMDNDDFRRGKPTNHKVFGESTALLAGDALMGLAIDLLLGIGAVSVNAPSDLILRAIRATSEAMGGRGVIAGQVEENILRETPHLETLLDVFRKKTGALFSLSFLLPAIFAPATIGINENALRSFSEVGELLGVAFQIADDLEDEIVATPPPIHIRAYLSDTDSIEWIREKKKTLMENLPTELHATQAFTETLFRAILEKCEKAKRA